MLARWKMNSSYLQRRLSLLINKFEEGKIFFNKDLLKKEDGKKLIEELSLLRRLPDGPVDISSATPLVRSFARMFYNLEKNYTLSDYGETDELTYWPEEKLTVESTIDLQREYFNLLQEFFEKATGTTAGKFLNVDESFHEGIERRKNNKFIKRFSDALDDYIPKIGEFHSKKSNVLLNAHKLIGGLKCVIGGSSRFPETAFDSFRKCALYADTIFIPDPILPWMEVDRQEERFRNIYFLQSCLYLLKLKPLIDTDLSYPAVIVFPSWEKSLESANEETRDLISEFFLSFFSHYLNSIFEDESELLDYISDRGKELFRKTVISKQLFLPPGSLPPKNFDEALERYRSFIRQERSDEFIKLTNTWAPERLVFNGILERLSPQFHVRDNSEMLGAHPLFWLPVHYHYFLLCSKASNEELNQLGFLKQKTLSIFQGLQHPANAWLGNIPIEDIARLRAENCNEIFRKKLVEYFDALSNANFEEIDSIAAEVGRAILSLISEHDKEAKRIAEEYLKKHTLTLGIAILTLGVQLFPWLTPFLGSFSVLGPIGKYAYDKFSQYRDSKLLKNSLFGVLSHARDSK
jgi:hypothetical protein